jgi:hypothetical protein
VIVFGKLHYKIRPGSEKAIAKRLRGTTASALSRWARNVLVGEMRKVSPELTGALVRSHFVKREGLRLEFGFMETPETKKRGRGSFYGFVLHELVEKNPGPISSAKGAVMHKWLPVAYRRARGQLSKFLKETLRPTIIPKAVPAQEVYTVDGI